MKIYTVFKVKDPKAKRKEFVLDRVYTNKVGAVNRVKRLHKYIGKFKVSINLKEFTTNELLRPYSDVFKYFSAFHKSKHQQTYILEKALHGQFNLKQVSDVLEKYDNKGALKVPGEQQLTIKLLKTKDSITKNQIITDTALIK